jgi:hypothetical protein
MGSLVHHQTDHYSLKFLLDQRLYSIPQCQWTSKLLGFDFHVEFKPGVANVVADSLGLCPVDSGSLWLVIMPKSKDRFMERPPMRTVQP